MFDPRSWSVGRAQVAAFMFDPANDLAWTGGITASRPAQDGPLVAGATVERTASSDGPSPTPPCLNQPERHPFTSDRPTDIPRTDSAATR